MNGEDVYKKCCKAMLDAGITNPESTDGIMFCAGDRNTESRCPYDYCVVVEHRQTAAQDKVKERIPLAKSLREHGVSVEDIALILDRKSNTVRRYLRQ